MIAYNRVQHKFEVIFNGNVVFHSKNYVQALHMLKMVKGV